MTERTQPIDAQRLTLILHDLRLPAIKQAWPDLAARADKEGWPATRFLASLAEHEKRMGEKKAIIFSTHILEEVDAACTRAIIIDRGVTAAKGFDHRMGALGKARRESVATRSWHAVCKFGIGVRFCFRERSYS